MLLTFHNLSFRYKIPLRASLLVIITVTLITGSLMFLEYDRFRRDLLFNAESMAKVMANTLVSPIVRDDTWRVYEVINSPFRAGKNAAGTQTAELLMVLDARNDIMASTIPMRFPVMGEPADIDPAFRPVMQAIARHQGADPASLEIPGHSKIYVFSPVVADEVRIGSVLMVYSKSIFLPRYYGIAKRSILVTLLILALLLPVSWYWGRRMADPLVQLADCMKKVGSQKPEELDCQLYESRDEIGQAGVALEQMFNDLKAMEQWEKQVALSERMSALGRLSAGIAHEINNPLGGMLNAISTYKKHGNDDPLTLKTLLLLERGLLQIKETVAALLVEAKVESHPLTRQDIEDTHTLILPNAHGKSAVLQWVNDIRDDDILALPSTLVRQIVINLLLNATQAIEQHGHIGCHFYRDDAYLYIAITNDGKHIPPEHMDHMFEPFSSQSSSGHGLGLWMTYQIVLQLAGKIEVSSMPGETAFVIDLPINEASR